MTLKKINGGPLSDINYCGDIFFYFFFAKKKKSSLNCSVRPRLPIKMFFPLCSTSGRFRPVWGGFYMGRRLDGLPSLIFLLLLRRGHYHVFFSCLLFKVLFPLANLVEQHSSHPRPLWPVCELFFFGKMRQNRPIFCM